MSVWEARPELDHGDLGALTVRPTTILDKMNGTFRPLLLPRQNGAFWSSLLFWEGRGLIVPFYFVQDRSLPLIITNSYSVLQKQAQTSLKLFYYSCNCF